MNQSDKDRIEAYNQYLKKVNDSVASIINPEVGLVIWRCKSCDVECAGDKGAGLCMTCLRAQIKYKKNCQD